MKHIWQIIDVFVSRGRTVLTVWDSDVNQRKTLTLPGIFDFKVGQLVECDRLPGKHVRIQPLSGSYAMGFAEITLIPINATATVNIAIAI